MPSNSSVKVSNAFQIGLLGGLGVLTALLIGSALTTIANVLTYVFAAIFIALGLDPLVSWLETKGIKRALGVPLIVIALLVVLGSVIALMAPTLVQQASEFIRLAPTMLTDISHSAWLIALDKQFDGGITNAINSAGAFISDSGNWANLLGGVVQVGISVFNGVMGGFIILILSLYFMASMRSFESFLYRLVPSSKRDQFYRISKQIFKSIGRYVMGQVSIALINSVLSLIFMSIVGIPYAIVLACVSFVLAMIPLVGTLSAAAVNTLVAFTISPVVGVITLCYYAVYTQVEAYVISPRIMRKAVAVPGAVVVVAALAGGALLGILGALVAIPAAASVILIIRQVWMPRQANK
jgi:predicted PurR-regulated permease PerM